MPGSIFNVLVSIPWQSILKQAPALVSAAESLLSRTRDKKDVRQAAGHVEALRDRVAALEAHDRADAELIKRLAEQLEALTLSTRVVAARVRLILWLASAGCLAGFGALVIFVTRLRH